jgi:hypothetical protein
MITAPKVTLADIEHRATVSVEVAGKFLGVSRDSSYAAARTGELPTIRIGHRLLVPVPKLLAMVGHEPAAKQSVTDGRETAGQAPVL